MDDTYYAIVDDEGICIATIHYATVLNEIPGHYIPIDSIEMTSIVGYTYDNGEWVAPPDPDVE